MKCKKCGAQLPVSAKFCDICGTKIVRETYEQRAARETQERVKATKRRKIRRIVIAAGILALAVTAWTLFWPKHIDFNPDLYSKSNKVSAEEYAKIAEGMTYKQIRDELGKGYNDGTFGNAFWGSTYYIWPGEYIDKGLLYSEVRVFIDKENKKCDYHSERNVIDGEEIFDNLSNERKAITKKKKEDIEAIKTGMTYEHVVDLLGIEGVLTESSSNSEGNVEKTYKWHYYDEYDFEQEATIYFDKGKVRDVFVY